MMAAKTSKSSPVVAAVVRSTIRGLGRLSLPNARRLGRGIGALLWRVPNQFRDASLRNVRRCFPELGEEDQRRIVRVSLISTGLNVVEAGAMFHGSAEQLQELEEEVVGSDILDAAVARGRGVLASALALTRYGGSVVLFAHAAAGECASFELNTLFKHERRIFGSYSGGLEEQSQVFSMMLDGTLDPSPLVSHRLPLVEFDSGVAIARRREGLKIIFAPG